MGVYDSKKNMISRNLNRTSVNSIRRIGRWGQSLVQLRIQTFHQNVGRFNLQVHLLSITCSFVSDLIFYRLHY